MHCARTFRTAAVSKTDMYELLFTCCCWVGSEVQLGGVHGVLKLQSRTPMSTLLPSSNDRVVSKVRLAQVPWV